MKEQLGTPSYAHHASVAPDELSGVAVLGQLSLGRSTAAEGSAGGGGIALTTPTPPAAAPIAADAHVGYMYAGGGGDDDDDDAFGYAAAAAPAHGGGGGSQSDRAAAAEVLAPWLAAELGPCLVKRLGRAQELATMPLALLAVLPGLFYASIAAFDCDGFGCSKAAVVPPRDFLMVQAAALPIALLAAPLPLPLALAFIRAVRSVLCRCCASRCVEFVANVTAAVVATPSARAPRRRRSPSLAPHASARPTTPPVPRSPSSARHSSRSSRSSRSSLRAPTRAACSHWRSSRPRSLVPWSPSASAGSASCSSRRRTSK